MIVQNQKCNLAMLVLQSSRTDVHIFCHMVIVSGEHIDVEKLLSVEITSHDAICGSHMGVFVRVVRSAASVGGWKRCCATQCDKK